MELTLANIITDFLFNYLEKFISNLQISLKLCPDDCHLHHHPDVNPIISQHGSSASLKLSEVNVVMRRLGVMKDPCLDNNGNHWNNGDDEYCYGKDDFMGLFKEDEPSLREIREVFEVFDGNKDGFIDGEDLQRVIWELGFREGFDLGRCKKMIQRFDGNGDGVIDFQEFLKFMEKCLC